MKTIRFTRCDNVGGIFIYSDNRFYAFIASGQNRYFKTFKGAEKWMNKNGYFVN